MEDWEQFFVEKSRRRFDKERAERRRQRKNGFIAAGVIATLLAGAIVALIMFR